MIKVKICGVTTPEQAVMCAQAGADLLGLNLYPRSPRYVTPAQARQITDRLRADLGQACPVLVGVFVNESVSAIARVLAEAGLDVAQLSGDESPAVLAELRGRAFKAIRPRHRAEALADAELFLRGAPTNPLWPALLVDAYHKDLYGGTGEQPSVEIAQAVRTATPRLILAGGLTPENVAERMAAICPWGVDVASGVESAPGIKDADRVRVFIEAVRRVQDHPQDTIKHEH